MYKLEAYKTGDKELHLTLTSYNLSAFDKYKNKSNYKIKIYKKSKTWVLIYNEVDN